MVVKKYALSEDFKPLSKEEAEALLKDPNAPMSLISSRERSDTSLSKTDFEPLDNEDR